MYNWSVDTRKMQTNPEELERFISEQKINFGLNNTKLSKSLLLKYWNVLDIDPSKRTFLKKLLWQNVNDSTTANIETNS